MQTWFLRTAATAVLVGALATTAAAQKSEFSADMRVLNATGQTETVKLYVGNQRVRLDRTATADDNGMNSLIIDFYHQMLFLVAPKARVYMRIAGSEGIPFYQAAWMFRPAAPDQPCGQWVVEADRRRVTLRCQRAGDDTVDGRTTQRWEATSPQGAHGFLSYDPNLNFVVRVMRTSKEGVQTGFELQNIKPGTQPETLFDPHAYQEFSITRLLDALTAVGQW
jgi:hypothetical protein